MYTTISSLIDALDRPSMDTSSFTEVMSQVQLHDQQIAQYLFYVDSRYTRNLVFKSDNFEMLLLCWDGRATTPIHDHSHSEGWMHVVKGELEETIYREVGDELEILKVRKVMSGQTTYITNRVGVHSISHSYPKRSVSLHIYRPRITSYHCIDRFSGKKQLYHASNYSEYGSLTLSNT